MTDPSLDPILSYLREHSGRYSLSALCGQLLQAGYDPAEVDRAIAIYQRKSPLTASLPAWPKVLQVVGINVVLGLLAIAAARGEMASLVGFAALAIFWGELLGGIVLAVRRQSRVSGLTLVFGFLLTAALVLMLSGFSRLWRLVVLGLPY